MVKELKETFNENPANYDRYRPKYTKALFDDIIAYSKLNGSSHALEVGIGTGQATLPFLSVAASLTAVDIGENMIEYCRVKFADYPNLKLINASFEEFESDGKFNLIYSATAFHWIPDEIGYPKALELLEEGGTIAIFRNHPFAADKNDPVHIGIQEFYDKYMPSSEEPRAYIPEDSLKILRPMEKAGFKDCLVKSYKGSRQFTPGEYINLLNTYSDHMTMACEKKKPFEEGIMNTIERLGGVIRIEDTMELCLGRKL